MFLSFIGLALAVQAAPPAEAKADKPKVQCRSEVSTGTRIGRKRTCASQREWDDRRQEQADAIAQDRARAERSRPCTGIPCNR